MAYHLESFELDLVVRADARLFLCDGDLFFHAVHALEVGQQQAAAASLCADYAVAVHVEFGGGVYLFCLAEDIDAVDQLRELLYFYGVKARVRRRRAAGLVDNLTRH